MGRSLIAGAAVSATLLTALITGSAWAQDSGSQTLQLTPSRDSGVSGTATLTETGEGVEVRLELQGLPEGGVEHLAHIHSGATCADDRAGQGGPVEFPLTSVQAQDDGTGSSTTTVDTTFDKLFGGQQYYVNVHAEQRGEAVPPGISCADVAAASGTGAVPTTGGISATAAALLAGGAALILLGAASICLLRRRAA